MKLLILLARVCFTLKWVYLIMRSGWTSPNTAVSGAPISASDYNTYVRDNLTYLFSQRPEDLVVNEGSAHITTSSTSFVAVSTTLARMTKTVNSGRYEVTFTCTCVHSDAATGSGAEIGGIMAFDVLLDGATRAGGTNGLIKLRQSSVGSIHHTITITARFIGLSVGSHTFDLAWKTSGATATLLNNAYPISMRGLEY